MFRIIRLILSYGLPCRHELNAKVTVAFQSQAIFSSFLRARIFAEASQTTIFLVNDVFFGVVVVLGCSRYSSIEFNFGIKFFLHFILSVLLVVVKTFLYAIRNLATIFALYLRFFLLLHCLIAYVLPCLC